MSRFAGGSLAFVLGDTVDLDVDLSGNEIVDVISEWVVCELGHGQQSTAGLRKGRGAFGGSIMNPLSRRLFLEFAGSMAASLAATAAPRRPVVSVTRGEDRRANVRRALEAIDDQIRPLLKRKRYVFLKPNCVAVDNQLGSTHADALRGILDYLEPRFRGPVVIADSSKDNTRDAFENFRYGRLASEYRRLAIRLIDLNEEADFVPHQIIDRNLHLTTVRLARRFFDPDAFILGSAILKAHDNVVVTLSVKNLVMAAPLHGAEKGAKWHDKYAYHAGFRAIQMNVALTARRMQPFWGATVIDGYEGMEGEGPLRGTPVPSRVAVASRDLVAADRAGVELMGVDPNWPGYLRYCAEAGLGEYDLARIDLRGEADLAALRRTYTLHPRIKQQLEWMEPLAR